MSLETKLYNYLKDFKGFIPIRILAKELDVKAEILDKKIVEIKAEFGSQMKTIGFKMPFMSEDKQKEFYSNYMIDLGFLLYRIKEVYDYENTLQGRMGLKLQIETWEKYRGY